MLLRFQPSLPVRLAAAFLALSSATQSFAHALQYQASLGRPLLRLGDLALYAPWRLLPWTFRLGGVAPEALITSLWHGAIAGAVPLIISFLFHWRRSRLFVSPQGSRGLAYEAASGGGHRGWRGLLSLPPRASSSALKPLLASRPEAAVLEVLRQRFPACYVVPQLALVTALDLHALRSRLPPPALRYLRSCRVDFGIVDRVTHSLVHVVEVQAGPHHRTAAWAQRDAWKRQACLLAGVAFEETHL